MTNPTAEFHRRTPKREPDYRHVVRWCGTPKCGQLYNIQLDARTERFISAATLLKAKDTRMVIVVHCIGCGCAINDAWLAECLTSAPAPLVYGRNHDDKDDVNGVIV